MEQREEFVRLSLLEGANRRELCRRFGISAETGYKWLRRWSAGETELRDHSRRPHRSPSQTRPALEERVLALRDAHPAWGARKLAARLERESISAPAASTVHAILRRNERVIETAGQGAPLTRFEKALPNQLWQMDFKGWVKLTNGSRCHPLTVVDDHSRYLVCLKACAGQTEAMVRGHLETVFGHHGLPEAMFVDNGSPWGGGPAERWTRFGVWLLKLGVRVLAQPAVSSAKPGQERTVASHVEPGSAVDDELSRAAGGATRVRRLVAHLYGERPHEALAMAVPADRYRPSLRPMPARLMEPEYDEGDIVRKVGTTKAYIQFKGRLWPVGQAFFGERVAIRQRGADGHYGIFFGAHRIGAIDLTTT